MHRWPVLSQDRNLLPSPLSFVYHPVISTAFCLLLVLLALLPQLNLIYNFHYIRASICKAGKPLLKAIWRSLSFSRMHLQEQSLHLHDIMCWSLLPGPTLAWDVLMPCSTECVRCVLTQATGRERALFKIHHVHLPVVLGCARAFCLLCFCFSSYQFI